MGHSGVDQERKEDSGKDIGGWLQSAVFGGGIGVVLWWLGDYLGLDGLSNTVQSGIASAIGAIGWWITRERKTRIVDAGQDPPMTAADVEKRFDESSGLLDRIRRALGLGE